MRIFAFSLISLFIFTGFLLPIGNISSFTVNGKIVGLKDGTKFYLIRTDDNGEADTLTSCISSNGKFKLQSTSLKQGEFVFIKMDTTGLVISNNRQTWIRLLTGNSVVDISGSYEKWPDVEILGSKATLEFEKMDRERERLMNQSMIEIREGRCPNIEDCKKKYGDALLLLLKANNKSLAVPVIALNSGLTDTLFYINAYSCFTDSVKKSYGGLKLKEYLPILKMMSNIKPANIIPNFRIFTDEGKGVSILDICKGNKLTLIDFWASWCTPCKAAIPTLLDVYNEYKSAGFNIVALSSDYNRNEWKKAVIEINTPWLQYIEGDTKIGKDVFGLGSIPAYILVNQKGELLAFDRGLSPIPAFGPSLREAELKKVVSSYLK